MMEPQPRDGFEPAARLTGKPIEIAAAVSTAISLKRLADMLAKMTNPDGTGLWVEGVIQTDVRLP